MNFLQRNRDLGLSISVVECDSECEEQVRLSLKYTLIDSNIQTGVKSATTIDDAASIEEVLHPAIS